MSRLRLGIISSVTSILQSAVEKSNMSVVETNNSMKLEGPRCNLVGCWYLSFALYSTTRAQRCLRSQLYLNLKKRQCAGVKSPELKITEIRLAVILLLLPAFLPLFLQIVDLTAGTGGREIESSVKWVIKHTCAKCGRSILECTLLNIPRCQTVASARC